MFDANKKLIYIGKAKNLKKRVSSYFRKNIPDPKTRALMAHVSNITTTITANETEALLLEANLIKVHRPRYNIVLRDDKSYVYLHISTQDKFPRLQTYRGNRKSSGRYFGPYPNAHAVHENLNLIQKLFKLRQCSNTFFKNRTRPCLQYQIQRCTAPCVGKITPEAYQAQLKDAVLFLEGKEGEVIEKLTATMRILSGDKRYEEATLYRNQISRLRTLQEKTLWSGKQDDLDVLGYHAHLNKIAIAVVNIRSGRLMGSQTFFPKLPPASLGGSASPALAKSIIPQVDRGGHPSRHRKDRSDAAIHTILSAFIPQYYLNPARAGLHIKKIISPVKLEEKSWIADTISEALCRKIQLIDHPSAHYQQWIDMATANAEDAIKQQHGDETAILEKLSELQRALKLPDPIQRIECFDISHTQGEATVASCVVCNTVGMQPRLYRSFNIRGVQAGDDYAATHQAITRRYKRVKEKSESTLPQLILIDGGKGQLKQAQSVMEELQITNITLLGIAKGVTRKPGMERLYLTDGTSVSLISDSGALHLIQLIRDEAHRFAITRHRKRRDKKRHQSTLENIPGIGGKRRQTLLTYFGGLQALIAASQAELSRVPGISKALAEALYRHLH